MEKLKALVEEIDKKTVIVFCAGLATGLFSALIF